MKKTLLIMKLAVIAALFTVAVVGIFAEPYGEDYWLLKLIISKVIGFAAAYFAVVLTCYWDEKGSFSELKGFCDKD